MIKKLIFKIYKPKIFGFLKCFLWVKWVWVLVWVWVFTLKPKPKPKEFWVPTSAQKPNKNWVPFSVVDFNPVGLFKG